MPFDPNTGTFIRPANVESFGVVQAPEGTMPVATAKDDILTFKTDGSIRIQGNAEDDSLLFGLNKSVQVAYPGQNIEFPENPKNKQEFIVALPITRPLITSITLAGSLYELNAPKRFMYLEELNFWVEI